MRVLMVTCALALSACYQVDEPICSYSCGPSNSCPGNYVCNPTDNYCHKVGHLTDSCEYSDASVSPDLAVPDLTTPEDGGDVDSGTD